MGNNRILPFAMHLIGSDEINEVTKALASNWLTSGPRVANFEKSFTSFVNTSHAIAVNSCTAGLHLALEAVGIGPKNKVITTPYTFTATAEVIRYLGADPIFVDIDPRTFNIDPIKIKAALKQHGEKIKAIMPVHFGGQSCNMDPILALARDYDIKIIEDAAHALPATYKGQMIGTIGDLTVYSFYATKTITTGEGGMVVTDNANYAKRMGIMRLHGIDRDVFNRYNSTKPSWYYEVVAPGFKYNMTDVAAAIGIHQLKKANAFQKRREEIANQYDEAFQELPLRTPWVERPDDLHAWHLYVVQLELDRLSINRDRFIELMSEAGIGTSVHFIPLHIQPYWRDRYGFKPEDFPVAHDVFQRAVSLPIYPKMTDADVDRVISAVHSILKESSR